MLHKGKAGSPDTFHANVNTDTHTCIKSIFVPVTHTLTFTHVHESQGRSDSLTNIIRLLYMLAKMKIHLREAVECFNLRSQMVFLE